jgi:hypothetical protein
VQLGSSGIGDGGLAALRPLRDLRQLSLMGTPITDAAVPVLGTMSQLRELDISLTRVTAAGVAELRRLLPDCAVLE